MKLNNIPQVGSEHFTYNPRSRTLTGFASDLQNVLSGPVRIYDDACDVGFYLVSEKTGSKLLFVESEINRNDDNEIVAWFYSAHCINENPDDLLDLKIAIFND